MEVARADDCIKQRNISGCQSLWLSAVFKMFPKVTIENLGMWQVMFRREWFTNEPPLGLFFTMNESDINDRY